MDIYETIRSIYQPCELAYTQPFEDKNAAIYGGCALMVNGKQVIFRIAKTTPTKLGQFVTLWKRIGTSLPLPFHEDDQIDLFVVNVRKENHLGQFIFPKSALIKEGVISSKNKKGKCAIRVYHPWDIVTSTQAIRTQKWQLQYFQSFTADQILDKQRIKSFYS